MYERRSYVALVALAVAALQVAAGFGSGRLSTAGYVLAAALGVVVFYQGERRLVDGPVFVNAAIAIAIGTVASFLFTSGLVMYILGVPWDLALWQVGILTWDSLLGIPTTILSAFFLVGFGAALT